MSTAQYINHRLLKFVAKRAKQYEFVQRGGRTKMADYAKKMACIREIRSLMQAASSYDLMGQCMTVIELQHQVQYILPSPYSKFKKQREQMLALLKYCREHVAMKTNSQNLNPLTHENRNQNHLRWALV